MLVYQRVIVAKNVFFNGWNKPVTSVEVDQCWLVVSLFFIFHNIWDVILPIDELIFFQMVIAPPTSWEFHHPNSLSLIFFRGVGWNHQPVPFPGNPYQEVESLSRSQLAEMRESRLDLTRWTEGTILGYSDLTSWPNPGIMLSERKMNYCN